ncbi:MAG: hypothetical protein EAZ43_12205 [Betaproteobacteria bacterium]|nr:MAG: hypothetical protein EAZ43_12205 [Betaproteobacteria bacterium]
MQLNFFALPVTQRRLAHKDVATERLRAVRARWIFSVTSIVLAGAGAVHAATCTFDTGGSDALNDGVVLTRFALGITGAPLIANTKFASIAGFTGADAQANIQCTACGLDVDSNGQIDTIDSTVIARHLTGFKGAALTNGLGLSASAITSVNSFIVNGCQAGGAINAFTLGGNAFGLPAVIGTTDAQPITLRSAGTQVSVLNGTSDGLRVSRVSNSANIVNGSSANSAAANITGATIAGGGVEGFANTVTGDYATIGGGNTNTASAGAAVVGGGSQNIASGAHSAVPGGKGNTASGEYSFAAGFRAKALHDRSFVWSANNNNTFPDRDYTSPGPYTFNVYAGNAINAYSDGQVNIGAGSGVNLNGHTNLLAPFALGFGQTPRQMVTLYGPSLGSSYGIGVQDYTMYFRNDGSQIRDANSNLLYGGFAWFAGGQHVNTPKEPGAGGRVLLSLDNDATLKGEWFVSNNASVSRNMFLRGNFTQICDSPVANCGFTVASETANFKRNVFVIGNVHANGTITESSDRSSKENIARASSSSVLSKVLALPISYWNYKNDEDKQRHIGPMAQDFRRLFGLGKDDKTIASMDRSGVALAAIQGLNQKLTEQIKQKDNEIARLKAKYDADIAAIKKKLGM